MNRTGHAIQFGPQGVELLTIASGEQKIPAMGRQDLCRASADATTRTSDQGRGQTSSANPHTLGS